MPDRAPASLLLVLEIRYSSAETGGASDETIFLPLFFSLSLARSLSGDTTEEAERGARKRKSADEQISLSLSLPSGAPRKSRLRSNNSSHCRRAVTQSRCTMRDALRADGGDTIALCGGKSRSPHSKKKMRLSTPFLLPQTHPH